MILCKVIGSIVSTIKHDCYKSTKLMLVRPISPKEEIRKGTIVAVDTVGAGKGEIVLVASEGRSASELLEFKCRMPMRSVIIGIVDTISLKSGSAA